MSAQPQTRVFDESKHPRARGSENPGQFARTPHPEGDVPLATMAGMDSQAIDEYNRSFPGTPPPYSAEQVFRYWTTMARSPQPVKNTQDAINRYQEELRIGMWGATLGRVEMTPKMPPPQEYPAALCAGEILVQARQLGPEAVAELGGKKLQVTPDKTATLQEIWDSYDCECIVTEGRSEILASGLYPEPEPGEMDTRDVVAGAMSAYAEDYFKEFMGMGPTVKTVKPLYVVDTSHPLSFGNAKATVHNFILAEAQKHETEIASPRRVEGWRQDIKESQERVAQMDEKRKAARKAFWLGLIGRKPKDDTE